MFMLTGNSDNTNTGTFQAVTVVVKQYKSRALRHDLYSKQSDSFIGSVLTVKRKGNVCLKERPVFIMSLQIKKQ